MSEFYDENFEPLGLSYVNGSVTVIKPGGGTPAISDGEISLVDGISFNVTLEADSYPGNIIAALYSGEDALKSVKSYPAEESVRVSFDKGQTGAYVKIMWWEDLSSMKPVCNSQIIPLQ